MTVTGFQLLKISVRGGPGAVTFGALVDTRIASFSMTGGGDLLVTASGLRVSTSD